MIGFIPPKCEVGAQFTKNVLLEIALNVQKCIELKFSSPPPIGKWVSGNFTKNILMEST